MNITNEQPSTKDMVKRAKEICKKRDRTEAERLELAKIRVDYKAANGHALSLNEIIKY